MTKLRLLAAVLPAVALFSVFGPPAIAQVPSYGSPVLQRPTFAAGYNALAVPQTGAGDAACIVGSATKTVYVTRVSVSGIKTTAQSAVVNLVKRTTASSGGVKVTAPTIVSMDSSLNNGGASATLAGYTTVPTPGTGAFLRSATQGFAAGTAQPGGTVTWTFDPQTNLSQQVVLRGVAQSLCVNYPNAFTTDGPALDVDFTWTEG